MRSLYCILVLIFFCNAHTHAQRYSTDSVISILLDDIEKNQIKEKGEFFPGMFYSFRGASAPPHNYNPDYNIFLLPSAALHSSI